MRLNIIDTSILAVFIDVLIPELWGGELAFSMNVYRYVSFHLFFRYQNFSLWDSFSPLHRSPAIHIIGFIPRIEW